LHQNSITLRNQREAPFLRVPAELRNEIYSLVLHIGKWLIDDTGRAYIFKDDRLYESSHYLVLLKICRQIYHETRLLPFSLNSFKIIHRFREVELVKKLTSFQTAAITRISLSADIRLDAGLQEICDEIPRHKFLIPNLLKVDLQVWCHDPEEIDEIARRIEDVLKARARNGEQIKIRAYYWR
jgi:hypothetical protein